jgi:hypothetical protein
MTHVCPLPFALFDLVPILGLTFLAADLFCFFVFSDMQRGVRKQWRGCGVRCLRSRIGMPAYW